MPPLITGLPASPGMATGAIVTNPEAAEAAAEAGRPAILVRAETSPDDVHGMARAAGILTSRGGLASHAAVVARGWGIPAVVGAAAMEVDDGRVIFGERTLETGAVITIDGRTGEVFEGAIPGITEVVPEARMLLAWALENNIDVGETAAGPEAGSPDPSPGPTPARRIGPDQCLRAIAIKGFASTQAVADAVLATPDAVEPILDQLAIDGLTASVAGAHRLTESGTARADALLDADRDAWGLKSAGAALDAFLELDHRVKEAVTAWQLCDTDAGVVNDHTDPAYDTAVLERLAALHADATAWFSDAEKGPGRLADYQARLGHALERGQAGDGRYVASPRVDSYHGIWFELHEDLIGLAGRSRADEVAAGRA
jgi:pyruvate,orthophosphate dikinase